MSPRYVRDRLARFWWLLLLCAVCAGIGGWIGGVLLFTVYSSTALIQVDVRTTSPTASTLLVADRLTHTGAQLAVSDNILSPIARSIGVSLTKLHSEVSAVPVANTLLVSITVRDSESTRAAKIANAVAQAVVTAQNQGIEQENIQSQQAYITNLNSLSSDLSSLKAQLSALGNPPSDPAKAQSLHVHIDAAQAQYDLAQSTLSKIQTAEASASNELRVASPARPSATPVISHQIATALAGVGLGLALGVFLAIGGDWLNFRVHSPDAVAAAFVWPRLGMARATHGARSDIATEGGVSDLADALTRDLEFLEIDHSLRSIALVCANPSRRTRDLAARLAIAYARGGRNTLLVDAYLSDGAQSVTFGVPSEPGLGDLILNSRGGAPTSAGIMERLYSPTRNADSHLRVLPSGRRPPNPDRVVASNFCKQVITALAALPAEITLLDTPAALFEGNVESLRRALDGLVIFIDPDTARRGDLIRLARSLAESETPVLGFLYLDHAISGSGAHGAGSIPAREARLVGK